MRLFWRRSRTGKVKRGRKRPSGRVHPLPDAPVEVQIMLPGSLDIVHARDVSVTGLGVYVPHGFVGCDLESEVELVVTLPGERSFMARGVIRHVTTRDEPARYFGVEFRGLAERNRICLAGYVDALLSSQQEE
jgi:hypothetical protein